MPANEEEQKRQLIALVRKATARDKELREKYGMGDKFRFVRDRLHALLEQLEKHVETAQQTEQKKVTEPTQQDEVIVFVYLYNSQGALLPTWVNMLTPKLFYEYSVNRPIYQDKHHIESLIRGKANPVQHAFLTIAVKPQDLIINDNLQKDVNGNPIIKVREGALRFERFISMTHNTHEYSINEQGLVKKS